MSYLLSFKYAIGVLAPDRAAASAAFHCAVGHLPELLVASGDQQRPSRRRALTTSVGCFPLRLSGLFPESPLTFHRILKSVFIHQDADNLVRRIRNDRAYLRTVLRDILQAGTDQF